MKKRAVVICPGRGTYTKETLGYLRQYGAAISPLLDDLDRWRRAGGEPTVRELDLADSFLPDLHTRGENASVLIHACAAADFAAIDRDRFEIVAVTGNSMGWYLALACAGALDPAGAFTVVNTMGSMMRERIVGGQVIYPLVDEHWRPSAEKALQVSEAVERARRAEGSEVFLSIRLGGFAVFGANDHGIHALLRELPAVENYPLPLLNHAAFHTPLMRQTATRAFEVLSHDLFHRPSCPLIDGRGCIWTPYSTDVEDLYHYTLGHQVVEPYDFTAAVTVALKEFAPDALVLLGPGSALGGAIGQILVAEDWLSLKSKADFTRRQAEAPFVLAMGRADQRRLIAL